MGMMGKRNNERGFKSPMENMGYKITITINSALKLAAVLNDSATATKLAAALPLELAMTRWGDEYYGACGVRDSLAPEARTLMAVGEIAYWPPGNALCLFFGPTPASRGEAPEAASEVNPVGMIEANCGELKKLGGSIKVKLELKP
jgi:hypothetical protein